MKYNFQKDFPLKKISTFNIGGKARYYLKITDENILKDLLFFLKKQKIPFVPIGNGSNVLFLDEGFKGIILHIRFDKYRIEKNIVYADAGVSLTKISKETAKKKLKGLEYFFGIPGTIGGAIYMNAGCYGKAISDNLINVTYLNLNGEIKNFEKKDLFFDYRNSSFQNEKGVILSAAFELKKNDNNDCLIQKQKKLLSMRKKTQPYNSFSIGSIFKNPKDLSAGKLIEDCGLKNFQIGGAKISDVHANFIINNEEASSKDVLDIIDVVKRKVYAKYQIHLEEELNIINDEVDSFNGF